MPVSISRPAPQTLSFKPTPVKTYTGLDGRQMLPNGTLANPKKVDITRALKDGAITRSEAQTAWKRSIK